MSPNLGIDGTLELAMDRPVVHGVTLVRGPLVVWHETLGLLYLVEGDGGRRAPALPARLGAVGNRGNIIAKVAYKVNNFQQPSPPAPSAAPPPPAAAPPTPAPAFPAPGGDKRVERV